MISSLVTGNMIYNEYLITYWLNLQTSYSRNILTIVTSMTMSWEVALCYTLWVVKAYEYLLYLAPSCSSVILETFCFNRTNKLHSSEYRCHYSVFFSLFYFSNSLIHTMDVFTCMSNNNICIKYLLAKRRGC